MSSRRVLLESLLLKRLPSAFQEVEYIESTGTQYVNTNMLVTNDKKVEVTYQNLTQSSSNTQIIFGTRVSYNDNAFFINYYNLRPNIENPAYKWLDSSTVIRNTQSYDKATILYDLKNNLITFSQNNYLFTDNISGTISNNYPIFLFALNNGGNVMGICNDMKLYSCKIYDNNILVRDFVPCYRKSDNEIGLYDLVNGVFYTNAGTGTFLKGANV